MTMGTRTAVAASAIVIAAVAAILYIGQEPEDDLCADQAWRWEFYVAGYNGDSVMVDPLLSQIGAGNVDSFGRWISECQLHMSPIVIIDATTGSRIGQWASSYGYRPL